MFNFDINQYKNKKVHFIGIGGVSMSALAEYLMSKDIIVSGSDSKKSDVTEKLIRDGATVYYGHDEKNISGADLIIYTDAISMENVELKAAIREKIDIVDRAEFLGSIMRNFENAIAVSGTHGKTTTTSMITEVIFNDPSNPTIMLGGNLDRIHGNIKIGSDKLFLTEACEYKANIKKYFPTIEIVLNIDEDHLDYFDNIDHIIRTFEEAVEHLDENAYLIVNNDDENSKTLKDHTKAHLITFGIQNDANYTAKKIEENENDFPRFQVYKNGEEFLEIQLSILGKHNVYNALAAIAATDIYGIDKNIIKEKISAYSGVHRRIEFKGKFNGADVIDDYAHHPTEIKSTLNALREKYQNKIFCIFQPHTFTRTKLLLNSFSESFFDADTVIITDIYAAREKDYGDIHSKMLVEAINNKHGNAIYIESFEAVEEYIKKNVSEGDCIVTMGAGDVYQIGENLLK